MSLHSDTIPGRHLETKWSIQTRCDYPGSNMATCKISNFIAKCIFFTVTKLPHTASTLFVVVYIPCSIWPFFSFWSLSLSLQKSLLALRSTESLFMLRCSTPQTSLRVAIPPSLHSAAGLHCKSVLESARASEAVHF